MSVLIVGSIALDDIKTPVEEHPNLLGGSASYAAVSAAYFSPVNLVGIVGEDFPKEHIELLKSRRIDIEGLQIVPGKTFRWSGEYMWDMNTRETRSVDLNVFEHFTPTLPANYQSTPFVLLANIAPDLQHHVLDQVVKPRFVIADTMDLWINIAKESLIRYGWLREGTFDRLEGGRMFVRFPESVKENAEIWMESGLKDLESKLARAMSQTVRLVLEWEASPEPQPEPAPTPVREEPEASAPPLPPADPNEDFKNDPFIKKALEVFKSTLHTAPA